MRKQTLVLLAVGLIVLLPSLVCWLVESRRDVVHNSLWDGSVTQVWFFLRHNWKDFGYNVPIEWGKVQKTPDGSFRVPCTFHEVRPEKGALKVVFTFGPDGQFVTETHTFHPSS